MESCGTIGILAHDKMLSIIRKVAPTLPRYKIFEFTYFEGLFKDSFEEINKVVDDIDIFVCGHGHSRLLLKWFPNKPVIIVNPLAFDIMFAIREAAKIDDRVYIINTYEFIEIDKIKEILRSDMQISQYSFKDDNELKDLLEFIRSSGGNAVVGGSSVNEIAPNYGLKPFYYYTEKAIRDSIVDAVNLVLLKSEQKVNQENLSKLIDISNVGLMVVDEDRKVQYANTGVFKMLNRSSANTIGIALERVLPDIALSEIEEDGKLVEINNKQLLCDVVISNPEQSIYRFQEVNQVEKSSYKIRRHMLSDTTSAKYHFHNIIGSGLGPTIEIARSYAISSDANILIFGPTGSGKELFASSIHNCSNRANEPFIPVNCAALPENLLESELFGYESGAFTGAKKQGKKGLIELAHNGTLFLDEIGEIPTSVQAKLLRVLQEKEVLPVGGNELIPVDIRVIAATNRHLHDCIKNNTFRRDLFYRLSTLVLEIPALSDRPNDVVELIDYYNKFETLSDMSKQIIKDVFCQVYSDYDWPGNVRELENVLERVYTYLRYTSKEDIPANELINDLTVFLKGYSFSRTGISSATSTSLEKTTNIKISKDMLKKAMSAAGGNKTKASKLLGISRSTLWRYQKTYEDIKN
jgi:propionate catabolism operon transcriptional regulator